MAAHGWATAREALILTTFVTCLFVLTYLGMAAGRRSRAETRSDARERQVHWGDCFCNVCAWWRDAITDGHNPPTKSPFSPQEWACRSGPSSDTPRIERSRRCGHAARRKLEPAWWAPNGFAAIPTAALDPAHRPASPAVPALVGSGSPSFAVASISQGSRLPPALSR